MAIRYLGYCCINKTLSDPDLIKQSGNKKVLTSRTLRLANWSLAKASQLAYENCTDLLPILAWNEKHNIKLFRISSDIFPFADDPRFGNGFSTGYDVTKLPDWHYIQQRLSEARRFADLHGVRLTMHPGPYTCLASEADSVRFKSILTLLVHALVAEAIGQDDMVINIHIGGTYGNKQAACDRFCSVYESLPESVKRKLTIENDDDASGLSTDEIYNHISSKVGIPIVFDFHHHALYPNGYSVADAFSLAEKTWANRGVFLTHYSESAEGKRASAHADYVNGPIPLSTGDIKFDCEIEAKEKERALLRLRERNNGN